MADKDDTIANANEDAEEVMSGAYDSLGDHPPRNTETDVAQKNSRRRAEKAEAERERGF